MLQDGVKDEKEKYINLKVIAQVQLPFFSFPVPPFLRPFSELSKISNSHYFKAASNF